MSELLTLFFGSMALSAIVIVIHMISAFHPYHRPTPTLVASLLILSLAVYAMSMINEEMSYMGIIRKSVSESILSLLNILPLIYISIAIILARVSVAQRKSGPV